MTDTTNIPVCRAPLLSGQRCPQPIGHRSPCGAPLTDPEMDRIAAVDAINWSLAMEVSRLKLRVAELEEEYARRAWSVGLNRSQYGY